jgi:hypothetical protein
MPQPKDLVINQWYKGIAQSPHVGFGNMTNVDIRGNPGTFRLNNLLENKGAAVVTDHIQWLVRNRGNNYEFYALGNSGKVYTSATGATWTNIPGVGAGAGQGLAVWHNYLFVAAGSTAIDVYGPLSGSPTWTNGWKTLDSDSTGHPMFINKDDVLYIGAGRYLASIEENSGQTFAPGTSASYTYTSRALDLPAGYRIRCIEELGNNLMLGTFMGNAIYDFKIADIFPWNGTDPSFDIPIHLNENGVNAMITVNNLLYVFAGNAGRVYVTNGTTATQIANIPKYIANVDGGAPVFVLPGAVINHNGRIYFGLSTDNSLQGGMGIWSIDPNPGEGNVLVREHTISTGNEGASQSLNVGAMIGYTNEIFFASWLDGSSYGIDKLNNSLRVTSYGGYIESPLLQVGTVLNKTTFQQGEFSLVKPLVSGQGVKIKYRKNLSVAFTTIGTFDFATLGGVISHNFTTDISEAEYLQIRIELTTGSSNLSPELREIRLR